MKRVIAFVVTSAFVLSTVGVALAQTTGQPGPPPPSPPPPKCKPKC